MDSVPSAFIERTILLMRPSSRLPFVALQSLWGRYAKRLTEEVVEYDLSVSFSSVPDVYYYDIYCQSSESVRGEELLEEKYSDLTVMCVDDVQDADPLGSEKLDEENIAMVQRLLKRSIGITMVILDQVTKKLPFVVALLLEAIPRVDFIKIINYGAEVVDDVSIMRSLVQKHVQQRCLQRLKFSEHPISRIYFPVVRAFLEDSEFYSFEGKFAIEDGDFAEEVISMIAASVKRRNKKLAEVTVRAMPTVLDVAKNVFHRPWRHILTIQEVEDTSCCLDVTVEMDTIEYFEF